MSESSDADLPTPGRPSALLAQRIEALFRRIESATVLQPDASLVLGRADALAEIDAIAESLAEALSSAVLRGVPAATQPVTIERSLESTARRWLEAWQRATNAVAVDELWSVALEHRAAFAEVLSRSQRIALQQRLEDANDTVRLRSPALANRWIDGLSPYTMLAARQLEWLAAGRSEASPFASAMELFERGSWPMLLPDGSILVWAPDTALSGAPTDSWSSIRAEITALAAQEPRAALARCALLGLGARVTSRDRTAATLVIGLADGSESRVTLGPLAIVGRKRGSDARVTSAGRAQWTVLALDRDAFVVEYTKGLSARGAPTETLCRVGARVRVGEIDLVAEVDATIDSAHEARSLLHSSECDTTRPFTEQRPSDKTSETAVQWAARSAARGLDASDAGSSAKSLIDSWTSRANFEPHAATRDDARALEWAIERATALFSAVHRHAECTPSAPSGVIFERSFVRACARVEAAWREATRERVTVRRSRILFGLDQMLRGQRERPSASSNARRSGGSVLLLARIIQRNAVGWSRDVLPFASRFAGIDAGALASVAQRAALAGVANEEDNPWAVLVSLWQSGALLWVMPDNGVLVFVPRGDSLRGLIINPDDEPPPSLPAQNFVASLLFANADPHSLVPPDWFDLVRRRTRVAAQARPTPEANLVASQPWIWAGGVRVPLSELASIDAEGRVSSATGDERQPVARIIAIDGEHWVVGEPRRREQLVVNGRTVRARPLAHGDELSLTRDAVALFDGRYECLSQRAR